MFKRVNGRAQSLYEVNYGKAKILIADDDQDIGESLKAILEGQQYTVVTAVDKAMVPKKLKSKNPT